MADSVEFQVIDPIGLREEGARVIESAEGARDAALDYRNEAATYAGASATSATLYPDEATGRADVADGEYFRVVDGEGYRTYRRTNSSTSVEINRVRSEWSDERLVEKARGELYVLTVTDRDEGTDLPTAGTLEWLDGSAGSFAVTMNEEEAGYASVIWTHADSGKTITLTNTWSNGYATPAFVVT